MDDTSVSPPTPPNASTPPAPDSTNHMLRAVIIWIVCSVIGIGVLALLGPNLSGWGIIPPIASDRSKDVYNVMFLFTVLAIPVFFMVVVFGGYAAFNFTRNHRPAAGGFRPAPLQLQVVWIVVSFILVGFLYIYGVIFLSSINAQASPSALVINVTGEQWLWNYSYPNGKQSSVLELPVNQPVVFKIQSIDVQHSFWIPAFGIKEDAVPGQTTSVSATPSQMGTYVVRCAELCGLYHAYMETPVYVVSSSDFQAWLNQGTTTAFRQPALSFSYPNALVAETARRVNGPSTSTAEG